MPWPLLLLLLLLAASRAQTTRPCFPGCQCEVETFGLFDSFSLTRVDCSGLGPHIVPVPIPLDTAHLDLSSNRLETVNESVLAGPGYTTLSGLDLSHNLLTSLSPTAFSRLRYLESLDLSHNGLAALPAESFTSSPLSDVNLSHNRLREVSVSAFATHSQGRALHVDLSHNLLHRLLPHSSRTGRPAPTIQSLNLAWNRLRAPSAPAPLRGWRASLTCRWAACRVSPSWRPTASTSCRACRSWTCPATPGSSGRDLRCSQAWAPCRSWTCRARAWCPCPRSCSSTSPHCRASAWARACSAGAWCGRAPTHGSPASPPRWPCTASTPRS
ncbi:hypothetical protein FD755_017292 [Muntiacus reevesi]|uniref:Tsukushi n=1 Tax=Muntiacus reevesi TaxID=9886 RepID=A0A5N3XA93_MUNRE|nr:hypothetical protein FD755_017292 [Muntiacus reevesi]